MKAGTTAVWLSREPLRPQLVLVLLLLLLLLRLLLLLIVTISEARASHAYFLLLRPTAASAGRLSNAAKPRTTLRLFVDPQNSAVGHHLGLGERRTVPRPFNGNCEKML